MSELTQKERLLNILNGKDVDRVPVLSVTQTGTLDLMKISGAYWPEAHRNANLMARLALAAHEIVGFEAVRIPFSLVSEAETIGCQIDYHEADICFTPSVKSGLKSLNDLKAPRSTEGLMGVVLNATKICKSKVGDNIPVIVGVTGPFTLAGHILGLTDLMKALVNNPTLVHKIEEKTCQIITTFSKSLCEEGADVITIIEPTGSLIGLEFFNKFCLPYLKRIVMNLNIPVVLHICGYTLPILESMIATGAKGLSIDQTVNIAEAKKVVNGRAAIIGNIDPVRVLMQGSPSMVEVECKKNFRRRH